MLYCRELDKKFETKEAMFKALALSATDLIDIKKALIHESVHKGQLSSPMSIPFKINSDPLKGITLKDGYTYVVINTTNYLDSHGDVHIDGLWSKSAKEQNGKTFYVADHSLAISNIIAWKDDVTILLQNIDWSAVGKDYTGQTEALIFEIPTDKLRMDEAIKIIQDKKDVQSSVRMQYVTMKLAIDSVDTELAQYKSVFDQYIGIVANKDVALEQGYFWAILEAKIVREGSMLVAGSNDATGVLQPLKDTENKAEPSKDTQKRKRVI